MHHSLLARNSVEGKWWMGTLFYLCSISRTFSLYNVYDRSRRTIILSILLFRVSASICFSLTFVIMTWLELLEPKLTYKVVTLIQKWKWEITARGRLRIISPMKIRIFEVKKKIVKMNVNKVSRIFPLLFDKWISYCSK